MDIEKLLRHRASCNAGFEDGEAFTAAADEITRLRADLALAQGQRDASEREIERLRAEVKSYQETLCREYDKREASDNEVVQLRDENAGLRTDAARYRWLREERFDCDMPTVQSTETGCIGSTLQGDELDAAIDAAMQKGG